MCGVNWLQDRTSHLPGGGGGAGDCTWRVNVFCTWAKLYLAQLSWSLGLPSIQPWTWFAIELLFKESLALAKLSKCLLKQITVDGTKACQTPSQQTPQNLEQQFHVPTNEEINFTLPFKLPDFFSSGLWGVYKSLEIIWNVYICIYIYFLEQNSFYLKESITISKKNMFDFHEKLVFSVVRRRALNMIIKCFISTEAQFIHLQKIIF